ncbi:allergen Asp f 7 homolog [Neodiprion fabricii]|uniref:allergen Asp f 7 homolog n=1 Tax=Neodiprion fabricii TaxID=2872261 RepID=UPI001ED9785B|nr:allergen Asp f 7 homolog [Neodiprion fabricii]
MTDPVYLAAASPHTNKAVSNPPAPWVLHSIDIPSPPLTRPPAVLLSLWDVRRARLTSPSYYRRILAPVSPFPEPQRSFVSTATQTTDSEWESPVKTTENRRPPTPPSSPKSRYTPPPGTETDPPRRPKSSLQPPPQFKRTKTSPIITWQRLF